ncbi:hydrogenase maturation protein HypF [Limnochorda pilosa]|uniref:Carbamoyltransferase n=1 Tax=Limnochorda pilosa TaxID=1555112 RepID=A0A0K2SHA4_LIMPI|nr:hydrogenase maturation protein HypF [Limnochorda pilosa]
MEGTVQGVGFRPFVYRVARSLGLGGSVRNTAAGVIVEAEGPHAQVQALLRALRENPPPLARVERLHTQELPVVGLAAFEILDSRGGEAPRVLVPPDVALCPDCRRELLDPADRRYRYAFTNCTNCGPRFTIVRGLPYDRPLTTMAAFPMCEACAREYHDPADRRFHAQPVACPRCGPRAWFEDASGRRDDWGRAFREAMQAGLIVALRGLGGFHLACDAHNARALHTLRERKRRPHRPLAVMARDLDTVRRFCRVSDAEVALLQSPAAPIVLLERLLGADLPGELAPGLRTLGVMLPYTPLHFLLFAQAEGEPEPPDLLVMTSGNHSSLPIVHTNEDARRQLGGIADAFLFHDRPIENRADDSVVRVLADRLHFLRRSRGYVPVPFPVPVPTAGHPVALGAGGETKNACCLVKEGQAFMGPHGGEMETLEGLAFFHHNLEAMGRILEARPGVVGYDPHPGYRVSRTALELPGRHEPVQHHHAHLAAVLAENGRQGPAVGIILDGTGYGSDGHLWGGEVLLGDLTSFQRIAHLRYVPLPGGERAIRLPWLTALAVLWLDGGREAALAAAGRLFPGREREAGVALQLLQAGINCPLSSGAGRYFDAVSAIAGVCLESTYEGEAAIELGEFLPSELPWGRGSPSHRLAGPYPFRLAGDEIDLVPAVAAAARERLEGAPAGPISARWHRTVAEAVVEAAGRAALRSGVQAVALSGGVFHNPYLVREVPRLLRERGFEPLLHRHVPPGDGGLALGQAVVALWRHGSSGPAHAGGGVS